MAATFLIMNAASLKRVLWLERQSRVVIRAPRLVETECKRLQEQMNRLLRVSGYGVGLAAVVAALALCLLWIGGHWNFFTAHLFPATGLAAIACLFAAGSGRAIGFLYARWRLARLIWSTLAKMDELGGVASIREQRARLLTRKTIAQ